VTVVAWFAWLLVLRKVVGLRLSEYARALRPPVIFSVVMAAAVGALQLVLARGSVGSAFTLAASVALGAAVYLGLAMRFDAAYVHSLWRLFRTRASVAA
jgi:hypothetical protein